MKRRLIEYHFKSSITLNGGKLFTQCFTMMLAIRFQILLLILWNVHQIDSCPPSEVILPCRCSIRGTEKQIWCSHSNLPQIMDGLKAVDKHVKNSIDELVLENNQLPALPGRFFGNLRIMRLMLRYNSINRLSNGWLSELEDHLVEIYIVEPQLRSIPLESLNGMTNMIAITIQSDELKHLPNFSGLANLTYLSIASKSLIELQPQHFKYLTKLQTIHISGSKNLNHLEASLFHGLISLQTIDLSGNGLNWLHLRALMRLPNAVNLNLAHNQITDIGMIGRIVKDLENLKKLALNHNIIHIVEEGSFVDLPHLTELHLNDNRITEIQYGAFLRTPLLRTIYLQNNHIKRIHPESFLQASGGGIEMMYLYNNEIEQVYAVRSLLEALPALKFLDISNNQLRSIHFGALRGHGTLEQLYINNNYLESIERDALMAMPALRELRLRNNSLTHKLAKPFWNLPGLKGLDLSMNKLHWVDEFLLIGLPSLRRLDLSENELSRLDASAFVHNPMLETLNISVNKLNAIHPMTIKNLNYLFELDVSFNLLTDFIDGLPLAVERISLRGNRLNILPMGSKKIIDLPNLRMMDLSFNHLTHLPKFVFHEMPQLRVLSLASNRLHSLDKTAFSGLHRLDILYLEENELLELEETILLPLAELKILNLQANRLHNIANGLFSNNSKLEQLNLSHNNLRNIATNTFSNQRSLQLLDLSFNLLNVSKSLAHLSNIRNIELSYNEINDLGIKTLAAWHHAVEIRLSNNLINIVKRNSFRNLAKLQYLDLSSNEITGLEMVAFQNLPDLQELVLADNKLSELKDHTFEQLPNLLAVHLQYNNLRYISSESFHNSPSILFLNLSNNQFDDMENLGLHSMRNIELLDLSGNNLRVITTMPLQTLNWLVELKVDNNKICKIKGTPFDTMPRLRVLSIQNNRLHTLDGRLFRNIRGNLAILDLTGNPIDCSCDMQWLSAWLEEINFPEPGPKCQDGRYLRSAHFNKSVCNQILDGHAPLPSSFSAQQYFLLNAGNNESHLPLLNDHGDIFNGNDHIKDECATYDWNVNLNGQKKPLPIESEYFYDQYIDIQRPNESNNQLDYNPASNSDIQSTILVQNVIKTSTTLANLLPPKLTGVTLPSSTTRTFTLNGVPGNKSHLNNTILNTKYIKKPPQMPQNSFPFTFFGYPIPSFNLRRFFGINQMNRKLRGENYRLSKNSNGNFQEDPTNMLATHRMQNYDGYNLNGTDILNGEYTIISNSSNQQTSNMFHTGFRKPLKTESGGFRPLLVDHATGGFVPIHDPSKRRGVVELVTPFNADNANLAIKDKQRGSMLKVESNQIYPGLEQQKTNIQQNYERFRTKNDTKITSYLDSLGSATVLPSTNIPNASKSVLTTINETTMNRIMASTEETTKTVKIPIPPASMKLPAPLTTAQTILLIPPSEELVEHLKQQARRFTTLSNVRSDVSFLTESTTVQPSFGLQMERSKNTAPNDLVTTSDPSTLFRNNTENMDRFLPTAEEYQHTTISTYGLDYPPRNISDRTNGDTSTDWYFESFKKPRSTVVVSSTSDTKRLLSSSGAFANNGIQTNSKPNQVLLIVIILRDSGRLLKSFAFFMCIFYQNLY